MDGDRAYCGEDVGLIVGFATDYATAADVVSRGLETREVSRVGGEPTAS